MPSLCSAGCGESHSQQLHWNQVNTQTHIWKHRKTWYTVCVKNLPYANCTTSAFNYIRDLWTEVLSLPENKCSENGNARGGKQYIREEGDEKLLLLIAFNLPFYEITDVHHCREKKTNGPWWQIQRKCFEGIPDMNSRHSAVTDPVSILYTQHSIHNLKDVLWGYVAIFLARGKNNWFKGLKKSCATEGNSSHTGRSRSICQTRKKWIWPPINIITMNEEVAT